MMIFVGNLTRDLTYGVDLCVLFPNQLTRHYIVRLNEMRDDPHSPFICCRIDAPGDSRADMRRTRFAYTYIYIY